MNEELVRMISRRLVPRFAGNRVDRMCIERYVPAGDHTLVVGRVLGGAVLREGEPLTQLALGWSYGG